MYAERRENELCRRLKPQDPLASSPGAFQPAQLRSIIRTSPGGPSRMMLWRGNLMVISPTSPSSGCRLLAGGRRRHQG